jgi:RNA polymerase sigma factor (sigma-70 family)
MVWGVCQRALGHRQDAEDAFQATFLLLARKAPSIVARQSVGGWLYVVACRVASEARTANARRRARECHLPELPHPESAPAEVQDWRPLLDRELNQLPEIYRTPVVLCELEGRGRKEVARQLGLPEGTLSSRLAAARRMLAQRLARRGVAVAVALAALAAGGALAAVPAPLLATTTLAAMQFATAGTALAGPAVALTKGVLDAMFLSKLKALVAVLMVTLTLAVGCFAIRATAGSESGLAARADGKDTADPAEALRKENEELKVNLRLTLEKIRVLEAELSALKARTTVKEVPFETGWDKPVDPDGDCKFTRDKGVLTIEVPNKDHDLGVERDKMNSPRLLRDVEGDFVAQVRVSGTFSPSVDSTSTERIAFVGAGLVLMADNKTYLRLERATLRRDGVARTYVNWELREDGEWKLAGDATVRPLEDKPTYVRLERRGDKLLASASHDGKEWWELEPLEVKLPAKLKLGVAAGTTSTDPFKPSYDDFRLTPLGTKKSD